MTIVIWIEKNQFGLEKLIKMENFNPIFQSGLKIFNPNFIKIENFNPIFQSGLKFQSRIETQFSTTFWIEIQKWQNQD